MEDDRRQKYYNELCHMLPEPNKTIFLKLLVSKGERRKKESGKEGEEGKRDPEKKK